MNLRVIKKDIEYVLGAFIEDCSVVAAVKGPDVDDTVSALMNEAYDLYYELKGKINADIEGPKKAYFAELRKEILEKTDALYEKLSESVKTSKPAAEKKPAAKKAPAKKAEPKTESPAEEKTPAKKAPAKKAPAKKAADKKEE